MVWEWRRAWYHLGLHTRRILCARFWHVAVRKLILGEEVERDGESFVETDNRSDGVRVPAHGSGGSPPGDTGMCVAMPGEQETRSMCQHCRASIHLSV